MRPLNILIFFPRVDIVGLASARVTYQAAQFAHMAQHANVLWQDDPVVVGCRSVRDLERCTGKEIDVVIVFDERELFMNPIVRQYRFDTDALFVYISHDCWCHPLSVAAGLRKLPRVLMVLRHFSTKRLFDHLLPSVPKLIQRPGVETSIFHPHTGKKEFDIILGGSERQDDLLRQRINSIVRNWSGRFGWNVIDLTSRGKLVSPVAAQAEYAPTLAAAKLSPTATTRGGIRAPRPDLRLDLQYHTASAEREATSDEFYGYAHPENDALRFESQIVTPRFLESFASKTLLIGDLPQGDFQDWYADKMVVVDDARMQDSEIAELIDFWVRHDELRQQLCEYAYQEVIRGETSEHRALELLDVIRRRVLDHRCSEACPTPCPDRTLTAGGAFRLDGRRGLTFFHQPEWTSNSWREVLRSYASAFTADDDVSLVLWLDPAQGLTPADAGERITGVLEAMPIEPGSVPDLLLVPDELDHRGIDRLYASVDWVVPHGDLAQAERARRTGARILHQLGAAHWRAARCKRTTDAGVAA